MTRQCIRYSRAGISSTTRAGPNSRTKVTQVMPPNMRTLQQTCTRGYGRGVKPERLQKIVTAERAAYAFEGHVLAVPLHVSETSQVGSAAARQTVPAAVNRPEVQHGSVFAQMQPATKVQLDEQQVSVVPIPGSHCSPPDTIPSPQRWAGAGVWPSLRQLIDELDTCESNVGCVRRGTILDFPGIVITNTAPEPLHSAQYSTSRPSNACVLELARGLGYHAVER